MKNLKYKILSGIVVTALLFVSAFQANAQKKAEFGLRFMPTFSAFNMKTASGGTVKGEVTLGYGFGAFLGFNFSEHVGIQAELIYNSISQKYKDLDVEHKINLKYINIPLLLSLNTGKSKPVNLNVVAGPQIGYSVGSSIQSSGNEGVVTSQAVLAVKKSDLGIAYGAGLDFGINTARTIRLGLGYRGVLGVLDISDHGKTTTTDSYYVLDRTHINTNSAYVGMSILF